MLHSYSELLVLGASWVTDPRSGVMERTLELESENMSFLVFNLPLKIITFNL